MMFDIASLTDLLAPLVSGGVIGAVIKRWWDKRDKQKEAIKKTASEVATAELEYDGVFLGRLLQRVESLEAQQETLRLEYLDLMRKNTKLETENERLKGDNERLKETNRDLTSRVAELEREIAEMREALKDKH